MKKVRVKKGYDDDDNFHDCTSKASMSRLLTSLFQFLKPGRNVLAIAASNDTFGKIHFKLFEDAGTNKRKLTTFSES